MNELMRQRLQTVIAYHQGVADQLRSEQEQASPAARPEPSQQSEDGEESEQSEDGQQPEQSTEQQASSGSEGGNASVESQRLIALHTEVAKQLRDVLNAEPPTMGIEDARIDPNRVRRTPDPLALPGASPRNVPRYISTGLIH